MTTILTEIVAGKRKISGFVETGIVSIISDAGLLPFTALAKSASSDGMIHQRQYHTINPMSCSDRLSADPFFIAPFHE